MLQITHQTSQQPQGLRHTWCSTLTWPNTVLRWNLHQQLLFSDNSWISSVRTSGSSPCSSCRLQWRRSFLKSPAIFGVERSTWHLWTGELGQPAVQCGVQRAKDSLPTPIHPEPPSTRDGTARVPQTALMSHAVPFHTTFMTHFRTQCTLLNNTTIFYLHLPLYHYL